MQVAGKDFDVSREIWENFVQEYFDDGAFFSVEIDGCGEKQRYGKWKLSYCYCICSWTKELIIVY